MKERDKQEINCPSCHVRFFISSDQLIQTVRYCPICKASLLIGDTTLTGVRESNENSAQFVTLVPGHIPAKEHIQFEIGVYQVIRSIGQGGMGEVFLAYDTSCGRRIALKRIRTDLAKHPQLHNRFLKEARVTSQLTHPAIIPIYAIHNENDIAYYTMPFVEGNTLKQILRTAIQQRKKGLKPDQSSSIPALIRIFLSVCQAVAYAHSKGVLHRDLKPENIIVGKYGEVLILDWGLAKLTHPSLGEHQEKTEEISDEISTDHPFHELTHIGKALGTVTYMAPERAFGQPATFATDVYSLGVILYQLLTLRAPFKRGTLKEFRKQIKKEVLLDPLEVAPYRDVPKILSRIACKCLTVSPEERYHTVDELIHDIENYIEGRSEWFQITELDVDRKSDWEFQENVLIAEHMAITRGTEVSDWVCLMISKASFPENTKLEAMVRLGNKGKGIGFLLSIPEASERVHLNSGYCLWVGSDIDKSTKLLRATVEVMFAPEIFIQRNEWYKVRLEKIDHNIHFYLNDVLQFSYISHLPLIGTHIGLLSRDADFSIKNFCISVGSQSIKVNCLAVPDAFLAHKDYATALSEYRRIGYSFPGTAEGREAMFRAGITLLEEANSCTNPVESTLIHEQALEEFGKLHHTPGAPLGYLGKALVYQAINDYEDEIKCFELAYRRYPHHPLLPVLQEQLVYRMHESSHAHRRATYHFVLLAIRHLPMESASNHTKKLFSSLKKHWEPLYFIEDVPEAFWEDPAEAYIFAIQVAFWLAQPYSLLEIIEDLLKTNEPSPEALGSALFSLLELGAWKLVKNQIKTLSEKENTELIKKVINEVEIALLAHENFEEAVEKLLPKVDSWRDVFYIMERAIGLHKPDTIIDLANALSASTPNENIALQLDCYFIWALLLKKDWQRASEIIHKYSVEQLTEETSLIYFLYGCWLYVVEGREIASIHFSAVLEVTHPQSWSLFNHFYSDRGEKQKLWLRTAFLWEKRQFYRQNALFYECLGDERQTLYYQNLEKNEYAIPDSD